jgi:hypothetical protein
LYRCNKGSAGARTVGAGAGAAGRKGDGTAPAAEAAGLSDEEDEEFFDARDDFDFPSCCCEPSEAVGDADRQLLVSVLIHVDPKLPTPLLNFVIGTALYMMWCRLLKVVLNTS